MTETEGRFEREIRPLFRDEDRYEMEYAFDLWSYEDVRENADAILERVVDGTMPCDAPWDEARIELLRAWISAGRPR